MAKRSPEDDVQVAIQEENRVNGSYDDADEDDIDHEQQQRKKKKKKKRKVRIMTASGQTDADRRVLRRRQRELHTDISFDAPAASSGTNNDNSESEDEEEETTKPSSTGLLNWREKNNALWDDVRYTREAVLDSENMDLISSKAAREVEKIIQVC